jgi:type 1 glutamine amidotransferase
MIWPNDKQASNVYRWLIEKQGAVFGVHAATTASVRNAEWYQTLLGAGFSSHQADQVRASRLRHSTLL